MRIEFYTLDGKTAVPVEGGVLEWAKASSARMHAIEADGDDPWRVANTDLTDGSHVSTVFLGLNHGWGDGPPLLFETMVFDGPCDGDQERCSTWEQAEAQHASVVARVLQKAQSND